MSSTVKKVKKTDYYNKMVVNPGQQIKAEVDARNAGLLTGSAYSKKGKEIVAKQLQENLRTKSQGGNIPVITPVVNNTRKSSKNTPINPKGKKRASTMQFPLDVEQPGQGHFITFHVKRQVPASIGGMRKSPGNPTGASLRNQLQGTMENGDIIAMYMPPQVQVSDNMKYADQEVGVGGLALGKGIEQFRRDMSLGGFVDAFGDAVGPAGKAKLVDVGLKALDFLGGGAVAGQIATGIVRTPHMELMFEGVNRREFNYTFTMTPRSFQEAREIEKIIKTFRLEMHPEYVDIDAMISMSTPGGDLGAGAGGGPTISRFMTFPSVFEIEYRFLGGDAPIPTPRICSLTKCDVTYGGGEGYISVGDGGDPQKVSMALSFSEIDVMTRRHVEAGH
jgi:hypothetical protein